MVAYSHSRISRFENCPYSYKLKYIDRVKSDVKSVENLLGSLVHETLESLYRDKKFMKDVSKEGLLEFFNELWEKWYSDDILIVKKDMTSENYRKMGEKFISDYYDSHEPFDDLTILGLETNDRLTLPDGNQWYVMIDKLACDDEGNYYVMDYKTNSKMKDQDEADSDRQLALYSIWVKNKFKDAKSVKLVWHMLAFDKDVVSERTDEQVEELQKEICDKIREINMASEFPRKEGALCSYCEYRSMCPSFKHEVELEEGGDSVIARDDGLKLVDEFADIKGRLSELKKRSAELKGKLADYAKEFGVDIIYGTNDCAKMKEIEKIVLPEGAAKYKFIDLLKEKGLWEKYSMVCYSKINSGVNSGELDEDVCGMCERVKDFRISVSRRKGEGE